MPIISSTVDKVTKLEGVHLFHYAMSSCSQRVRFVLAEKSISWTGHHIDLDKMEHLSTEYQSINPNGYVPTLVHDKKLVVESIDIIRYVEDSFDGVSLLPQEDSKENSNEKIANWLQFTDSNQWALKTLTYEFLFKKKGHFSDPEEVRYYSEHQRNQDLVRFVKDFHAGFSEQRINENLNLALEFMGKLDLALSEGDYIGGSAFSLADIAAVVNVHRYKLCEIPMPNFDNVEDWYQRVSSRPAFVSAIMEWV